MLSAVFYRIAINIIVTIITAFYQNSFQNMSFAKQLLAKSELVRRWFIKNFDKEDTSDIQLSESENKMFSSMERFHRLSHVRY